MNSINNSPLGMLLGKYFIEDGFSLEARRLANSTMQSIKQAFDANLPNLDWIDNTTREQALLKSKAMITKIGYPDEWPDFSSLNLSRTQYAANWLQVSTFGFKRLVSSVGFPVDVNKWEVPPQTVTAYNSISPNELVVPAGIIQDPFFLVDFPPPMRFAGIGMVCGHELTHGFDNQGRHYDYTGKLHDWWSEDSAIHFQQKADCFVRQYSSYEVQPGLHLNGSFTLGENIADNGGIKEAWLGYKSVIGNDGGKLSIVPGITNDELFFIEFGQIWCFKMTPEYERLWVATNSHSTPKYRVIGAISNSVEFAQVFKCGNSSKLNPPNKCKIW